LEEEEADERASAPVGLAPRGDPSDNAFLTPPSKKHAIQNTPFPDEVKPACAEVAIELSSAPKATRAGSLLDAMIARDGERAEQTKAKAAKQREEKAKERKAEKDAEKAAKDADKAAEKATKAAKDARNLAKKGEGNVKKGNASVQKLPINAETVPKVKKVPVKASPDDIFKGKPTMSHERTRSQYLCRTGLRGPGQTKAIKYRKAGQEHGKTQEEAFAEGTEWLTSHQ
jgi:hypothetical protein